MYPLGFLPFFYSLVPEWGAVGFALVIPILVLALWFYTIVTRSSSSAQLDDTPVYLPGSSLLHILPFFHQRFDFINQGFQLAGQAIYQFTLLRVRPTPLIQSSFASIANSVASSFTDTGHCPVGRGRPARFFPGQGPRPQCRI